MNACCNDPNCPQNQFLDLFNSLKNNLEKMRPLSHDFESQITTDMPVCKSARWCEWKYQTARQPHHHQEKDRKWISTHHRVLHH